MGEFFLDEFFRDSLFFDIFRGDKVWYILRFEGGDCFFLKEEFKELYFEVVFGIFLYER